MAIRKNMVVCKLVQRNEILLLVCINLDFGRVMFLVSNMEIENVEVLVLCRRFLYFVSMLKSITHFQMIRFRKLTFKGDIGSYYREPIYTM